MSSEPVPILIPAAGAALPNKANRQIARAAGIVMAAFVLSNLVGLLRQTLVSRAFGTGAEMDAFNAAVVIPDLLFNLLAGGALASAFIPTLTGFVTREERENGWKLASAVMNLAALALALASGLAALFAPQIVRYVLFALKPATDPAQLELTTRILRVVLVAPAIFGVSGLVMGVLNTHQKFWLPALAPVFNWLGWIVGLAVFVPSMGIRGLAWGYVLGAALHLLIQLPGLLRLAGRRYFATLGLKNSAVVEVFRLMGPRLFGVGVVQLNFVVNTMIAYSQPEGSVTALGVARMVFTMPLFVIASSIATAALPTFSAQFAAGKIDEMRGSLSATLRGVVLLSIPATLGLILLRGPIVALLFQYGKFDAQSTQLVSWALLWFAAGLVGHSLVEVLSRAFYALHDTRTPVMVGVAAMSINVALSFLFSWAFAVVGWMPHGGLALANSLATALEAVILLLLIRRRLEGLHGREVMRAALAGALGMIGMGLGLWGWLSIGARLPTWLLALGGVGLGGLVYVALLALLRVPELGMVWRVIQGRLLRVSKG